MSVAVPVCKDISYVLDKLNWMRAERIWPNGLRYTWTDAFGVVLLVSLCAELNERSFLDEAEWVVSEVERVLGRPRGIRIGEAADRDGQYFHYLAMWLYALSVLARHVPAYRAKGADLVRQIHDAFVVPGRGVIWKMNEDLSAPIQVMVSARLMPLMAMSAIDASMNMPWPAKSPTCGR